MPTSWLTPRICPLRRLSTRCWSTWSSKAGSTAPEVCLPLRLAVGNVEGCGGGYRNRPISSGRGQAFHGLHADDPLSGGGCMTAARAVRRHWWLLTICVLVGLAGGGFAIAVTAPVYSASASVLVQPVGDTA